MKILWFTWKDIQHPLAGGAEVVNHELAKRLIADGHIVHFIVGGFKGATRIENIDGYRVTRMPGGRLAAYWHAYRYYIESLKGTADLVIDEINTLPFLCKFYVKEKNMIFMHQLAREIWFYEMGFPFNILGFLLEPIYLWALRDRTVVTVSQSTKNDLVQIGFPAANIHIISEGITLDLISTLDVQKFERPTLLSLGSIRSMKRTDHIITAFEAAKTAIPDLQLIIAGLPVANYGRFVLQRIKESPYSSSIQFAGPVAKEQKIELFQKAHVLAVASVKEGWCLVVTEANSQGTPAVVYDVDGLRDSVQNGKTGLVTDSTPDALARGIIEILQWPSQYAAYRQNAWQWSKNITFDKGYEQFKAIIDHV